MRDKGRLKVGADADIALFDPATVVNKATFQNPREVFQKVFVTW